MRKNYKISLRYALATLVSVVFAQGTWAQENLPTDAGSILTAGTTYKVSSDITINEQQAAVDADGKPVSGLVVAGGSPVIIEICKGCTLTVNGTHAAGQYGAGAGISVPSSSTLIITGEGTLIAQGGNAGNGGDGERGTNPFYNGNELQNSEMKRESWSYTGKGGTGGYGGGGAGAGIGGAGGEGGAGGLGGGTGGTDNTSWTPEDASIIGDAIDGGEDGRPGGNGGKGKVGPSVGKVYINGNVTVNAYPGAAGQTNGAGGKSSGASVYSTGWGTIGGYAIAGGGGAGAGGGAGFAAPYGIGVGGRGAGGGGGGGGGAADRIAALLTGGWSTNYLGTANSCQIGGLGALGNAGGGTQTTAPDTGSGNNNSRCPRKGGLAGTSGGVEVEPAKGDAVHGVVYVASTAKLNEGSAPTSIGAIEIAPYSVTAINDNNTNATPGVYGMSTINSALEAIKYDENITSGTSVTFTLNKDANVGSTTLTNPGKAVTLDLNGKGLLVDGAAGDITGNANVTILLKDDGDLDYTNRSYVSNTPVKYQRNFAASTRSGKWQALYLPFDVDNLPEGYDFGIVSDITANGLVIDKDVNSLEAFVHHSVRSANGMVNIEVSSETLKGTSEPQKVSKGSEGYALKGSLTKEHNKASEDKAFWVLTNGGKFTWAKSGSHQRPYHWVVYAPAGSEAKSFALYTLGEDIIGDATVIDAVVVVNDNEPIYTISGVKVANSKALAPGMYIKGGKKFTVSK